MTTLQNLYFVVGAFVAAAGLLKLAQVVVHHLCTVASGGGA